MKKLAVIFSSALLVGVVHAQDTIELTSGQMDQVTAGAAGATATAFSGGGFVTEGWGATAGSSSYTGTATYANDYYGVAAGGGVATNSTGASVWYGGAKVLSGSYVAVIVGTN